MNLWAALEQALTNPKLVDGVRAGAVLLISLVLAKLLASMTAGMLTRASAQHRMLGRRVAFYSALGLGVMGALSELGFHLSTLLGAAGIVSVALGFAAQTSASNFIAGLFLIGEQPFVIGDVVRIGATTGEVLSIDLISIKLRTDDNLFVRVPNETVVKSEVVNLTHFPIRRLDLAFGVGYKADLQKVRELLFEAAHQHPLAFEDPKPQLLVQGFGEFAIGLQFGVWTAKGNFFELKTALYESIKLAFEREGIELCTVQRSIDFANLKPSPVTSSRRDT
jgi:small-conductance mechanosensitive channel